MDIREQLQEQHHEDLLFLDERDFDVAILGVMEAFGGKTAVAYDLEKVFEVLMARGMTREEAEEWYSFNMIGAWMGEQTPVYVTRFSPNSQNYS